MRNPFFPRLSSWMKAQSSVLSGNFGTAVQTYKSLDMKVNCMRSAQADYYPDLSRLPITSVPVCLFVVRCISKRDISVFMKFGTDLLLDVHSINSSLFFNTNSNIAT